MPVRLPTRRTTGSLAAWNAALLLLTLAFALPPGCGKDTTKGPQVDRDPTLHEFVRDGFSLTYGTRFKTEGITVSGPLASLVLVDSGVTPPRGQTLSAATGGVTVTVDRKAPPVSPENFMKSADQFAQYFEQQFLPTVKDLELHHTYQPTSVGRTPALCAAFQGRKRPGDPLVEQEWYVLIANGRLYTIAISAAVEIWADEAEMLRGVVQSFGLIGPSAAPPAAPSP